MNRYERLEQSAATRVESERRMATAGVKASKPMTAAQQRGPRRRWRVGPVQREHRPDRPVVAERLERARIAKRLTMDEAGELLGLAPASRANTISRWESGHRDPTLESAVRAANAYGVSLDWLTGRKDEP